MGTFGEYCRKRELDEGIWMNDDNAIVGLSKIRPPKPAKPIKPFQPLQNLKPFKPKPVKPPLQH